MALLPPIVHDKWYSELPDYWKDWFFRLRNQVTVPGTTFTGLDFTASNLTSIVTRDHNNLTSISGGAANDYFHFTSNEYNRARPAVLSLSVAGATDVTLSVAQANNQIQQYTGVLTGNINVIFPVSPVYQWTIFNNTTGAFTLTVKPSGGTGIVIATARKAIVYNDGVNMVRVTADSV